MLGYLLSFSIALASAFSTSAADTLVVPSTVDSLLLPRLDTVVVARQVDSLHVAVDSVACDTVVSDSVAVDPVKVDVDSAALAPMRADVLVPVVPKDTLATSVDSVVVPKDTLTASVPLGVDVLTASVDSIAPADTLAAADSIVQADSLVPIDLDRLAAMADSLRLAYDFAAALDLCNQALEVAADSLKIMEIEECQIFCQNGVILTQNVFEPNVLARERFHIDDFFLYLPLPDSLWHRVAGVLPEWSHLPSVVFSRDSVGVSAEMLEECFAVISEDGMTKYFSSASLAGLGGYDLYESKWDEKKQHWGEPQNLGLPFCSPYDDFLLMDVGTDYTIFASNRDCPLDSVDVYVTQYDGFRLHAPMEEVEELRTLMKLDPSGEVFERRSLTKKEDDPDMVKYWEKHNLWKAVENEIAEIDRDLADKRNILETLEDEDEKMPIFIAISQAEAQQDSLRVSLDLIITDLRALEGEMLQKGKTVDFNRQEEEDIVDEAETLGFVFERHCLGDTLQFVPPEVEEVFEYTFSIGSVGQFAPDLEKMLEEGVFYQVQIFSSTNKATVSHLKGVTPVFERRVSGRYNYSAGLFRSYKEATAALNQLKKYFKSAYIIAYQNGTPISVSKARSMTN